MNKATWHHIVNLQLSRISLKHKITSDIMSSFPTAILQQTMLRNFLFRWQEMVKSRYQFCQISQLLLLKNDKKSNKNGCAPWKFESTVELESPANYLVKLGTEESIIKPMRKWGGIRISWNSLQIRTLSGSLCIWRYQARSMFLC